MNRLLECLYRERLLDLTLIEPLKLKSSLSTGAELTVKLQRTYQLNRFDLREVIWKEESKEKKITDPLTLLTLLQREAVFPEESYQTLFKEVENSVQNYALSLQTFQSRVNEINKGTHHNSIDWCLQQVQENNDFSPLAFFEQLIVHGHTLHPCTKTKLGFSKEEVVRYSPECGGEPSISFVAVKRDSTHVTSIEGERFSDLVYQEFPHLQALVRKELLEKGLIPDDYEIIPVHPWQLEHTLPTMYEEPIKKGELVILSEKRETYALASLRTLLAKKSGRQALFHIKTAINVQATSAIRTVSPPSTIHGPKLSTLFTTILQKEKAVAKKLSLLKEYSGIHYRSKGETDEKAYELGKNLAAIIRQNPEELVSFESQEMAIPAVSLISDSPFSNKPVLLDVLNTFKKEHEIASDKEAVITFMKEYVALCFSTLIPFMTKYGVSFEAHLQNSIPVFQHGKPVRLIIRDYGGIKLYNKRLEKQGLSIELEKGSHLKATELDELYETFSHAVIQNHLGELIICLVKHLPIKEQELWEIVQMEWMNTFDHLKQPQDQEMIRKPFISLKSLVKMRLYNSIENEFVAVNNPLWKMKEGIH
nr:IucA/IucC family protein [Bacillus sp. FJAT-47783]